MSLVFEWNENKAATNLKKHRVSFEEAKSIFLDPNLLTMSDEAHSKSEDRFINIGMSQKLNVLVVIHTERYENVIRIISGRMATKTEQETYEANIQTYDYEEKVSDEGE